MKRNLLLASVLLIATTGFSQMRVGSNAAATEMLHVEGAILIGTSTIGAPEAGTIRWNPAATPDPNKFEGFDGTNWIPLQGDNLGDHIATENLQLDGNWLSNDGGNEGIGIDNDGNVGVGVLDASQLFHVKSTSGGERVVGLFEHYIPSSSAGSTAGINVTGRRANPTNDYAFIDLENNSTGNHIRLAANSANGGLLRVYSNATELLSLASSGALTINNAFTLPTADGSNGQVLTTDGSGNTDWETSPTASFTAMQGGKADVGGSGGNEIVTINVTFPNAFTSIPNVICTASAQPTTIFDDSFNVTTRSITATGFTMIVNRVDGTTWGQDLDVHWFAFQ